MGDQRRMFMVCLRVEARRDQGAEDSMWDGEKGRASLKMVRMAQEMSVSYL